MSMVWIRWAEATRAEHRFDSEAVLEEWESRKVGGGDKQVLCFLLSTFSQTRKGSLFWAASQGKETGDRDEL